MPADALILQSQATPLSKSGIASLADAASPDALSDALARALETGQVRAATNLALAIGAAGGRIAPPLALAIIPDFEELILLPVIAGIIEGDRATTLLDLVDRGQLSWEREALVLYLVTHLSDQEVPPRLVARLRTLAREPLSPQAALLVGLAAEALNRPDVDAIAEDLRLLARRANAAAFEDALVAPLFKPVLESLPEREETQFPYGHTVVRTAPKVGRNDPCPCGSGRKYKKCCASREQEAASRKTIVEQFAAVAPTHARLRDQMLDEMRPGEVAQLDPSTLTTLQLLKCIRHLTLHHRFAIAERFFDVFAGRPDVPGDVDGHRMDLIDVALNAGELEFAERQIALANLDEKIRNEYRVRLALARRSPDALDEIERLLHAAHDIDQGTVIECTFALLQHYPALGILAARGCISATRLLDAEMLLSEIERARDRLGLDPVEPWWDLFDLLVEHDLAAHENRVDEEVHWARERELEGMRAELEASKRRERRLDSELNERIAKLDFLTREREALTSMAHTARKDGERQRVTELEHETQRLRTKIAELKGEITEGVAQRSELRRQLAQAADTRREEDSARKDADAEGGEHEDADDAEEQGSVARPRRILAPRFLPAASRALSTLPSRIAADALQEAARLGSADAHTWNGVKRMRAARDVLSIRIGRAHRLLFEHDGEHFDVLDVIHRRDLDAVVHRFAARSSRAPIGRE